MSVNREKALDKANTKAQIENRTEQTGRTNWLGHAAAKGTAALDAMLLDGATMEQLLAKRGAVQEHFGHLKKEHDLLVEEVDGKYRFSRKHLGVEE